MSKPRLSIFSRFKTGNRGLTGEAKRQRSIIMALAAGTSPPDRTRTGIAQRIAEQGSTTWKNIYSGIFRDLDEVLLPMRVAEEEGRLPLKRGPKALQEMGIPYYRLTGEGMLVAAALAEPGRVGALLDAFFDGAASEDGVGSRDAGILRVLSDASPSFVSYVMRRYVEAFCDGAVDRLAPLDLGRLQKTQDQTLIVQRDLVRALAGLSEGDRGAAAELLEDMAGDGTGESDDHKSEDYNGRDADQDDAEPADRDVRGRRARARQSA